MKGNYPYAVLHTLETEGFVPAVKYARRVCKSRMTYAEAKEYVEAVEKNKNDFSLIGV